MKIKALFFLILFVCSSASAITEDEHANFVINHSNIAHAKFKECSIQLNALVFSSKKNELPRECAVAEAYYKEIVTKALELAPPAVLEKLKSSDEFVTILKNLAQEYYLCRKKWTILLDLKSRSLRV